MYEKTKNGDLLGEVRTNLQSIEKDLQPFLKEEIFDTLANQVFKQEKLRKWSGSYPYFSSAEISIDLLEYTFCTPSSQKIVPSPTDFSIY